jgi:hypothetical protein
LLPNSAGDPAERHTGQLGSMLGLLHLQEIQAGDVVGGELFRKRLGDVIKLVDGNQRVARKESEKPVKFGKSPRIGKISA